jgi:REase_DpnII-MboI
MKATDEACRLQEQIDWLTLRDLREIDGLGARAVEVLKGVRVVGCDDFLSSAIIHQIIYIQAGKAYSSTPSNISTALQKFTGALERRRADNHLKFRFPLEASEARRCNEPSESQVDRTLLNICERFHRAVVHLSHRRKGRPTINFSQEYDVQDVFGTVLKCSYEDVRNEEWTPSYAGKSARIDFVITDIRTATELKRVRSRQEVSDELTLDIKKYSKHPDVDRLVCFVYDPDGLLRRDAAQIEKDLSQVWSSNGRALDVVVLVRPK